MNFGSISRMLRAPKTDDTENHGQTAPVDDGDLYGVKSDVQTQIDDAAEEVKINDEPEVKTKKADPLFQSADEKDEILDLRDEEVKDGELQTQKKDDVLSPQTLKLDAETIAALRREVAPVKKTQQEETLTPEQIKTLLNPVDLKDPVIQKLFLVDATPEEKAAALQAYTAAVVRNATSVSRLMLERKEREFAAQMSPLVKARQEAEMAQNKNDFYESNKDLLKFEKIVKMAATDVQPNKADGSPKTKAEIFKEVSDLTRATLKDLGIPLSAPANLGSDRRGVTTVPKANVLSSTGRSGGDTSRGKSTANDPDADIYKR